MGEYDRAIDMFTHVLSPTIDMFLTMKNRLTSIFHLTRFYLRHQKILEFELNKWMHVLPLSRQASTLIYNEDRILVVQQSDDFISHKNEQKKSTIQVKQTYVCYTLSK